MGAQTNRDSPKLHKCYFFYMCKHIFSKVTMSDQIGPLVTIMSFFLYWESRFQDRHTTVVQLPEDCLMMSAKRLPEDCQKTARRLHEDSLNTAWWPPKDHLKTIGRQPEDHLKTTRRPPDNHQKTARRQQGDCHTTTWTLTGNQQKTSWRPTN